MQKSPCVRISRATGDGFSNVFEEKPELRLHASRASLATSRASAGKRTTTTSRGSQVSEALRARNQPRLHRSETNLSRKTDLSQLSAVPDGLEIGELRSKSCVGYTTQWGIRRDYEFQDKLGEGGYGQVWRCQHKTTHETFAVKCIPAVTSKDSERYERELKVFERLSNPHVVHLHEIFRDEKTLYLVMEICTHGDLMDFLGNYWIDPDYPEREEVVETFPHLCVGIPSDEVGAYLWQTLAGVAYLHHYRFCHRDVKLENYMLKEKGKRPHVQLCDFGLSVRLAKGEKVTGSVGTLLYMAPEVLTSSYDQKCDLWSVAVCWYLLCTASSPWGITMGKEDICMRIKSNQRVPWPFCDKPAELRQLVDTLMSRDPLQRPSAKEVFRRSTWLQTHSRAGQAHEGFCCTVL